MIFNIRLEAVPKYIFLPVIQIMNLAPIVSNYFVNRGCNYLVLIPRHDYLLGSELLKILRKPVDYVTKTIV